MDTKLRYMLRKARRRRIRAKIKGTSNRPRLCVFRSNKYLYAQLIDDKASRILAFSSGKSNLKDAYKIGEEMAKKALAQNIKSIVFDRSGYKYHGQVKAVSEGARKGGLQF
ncbi:50S ribosomal protein L18 [bacterium]|nr:50S ribosomal protein L18 [bacterium]